MPLTELLHIHKRFGRVVALEDVSLALAPGRVHGVLGENGAGKSTLMNVLYGLVRPDAGEIRIGGRLAGIRSAGDAVAAGIGMVHQHFMLAGRLTVLDNVLLGDRRAGQWLDRRGTAARLRELSQRVGLAIDPFAAIDELSVGQQQRVEILKALWRDVEVLILDEPTAVLTPQETDQLLETLSRLRGEGKAVAFISHKLGEVKRICDDLTILRRGKVVWEGRAADATAEELAEQMIGARVGAAESSGADRAGEARAGGVLRLENVCAAGLEDVCLSVGAEIVGVAGVDGNGQQELAEAIVGLRPVRSGRILMNGEDMTRLDVRGRGRFGIAHIPNDRQREGLVVSMGTTENIAMMYHARRPFSRLGIMRWREAGRVARELSTRFDVRQASVDAPVARLSGGNQQKVVLARELGVVAPRLIVAINPTRGLDIAATRFVHEQLRRHRGAGCAVVLISSELDELMQVAERIAVLYRGRLVEAGVPHDSGEIGRLMMGVQDGV